jgi:hypothetical protein
MLIIWCLVLHFIADGLLQSREIGKKKSIEFKWLLRHLMIQVAVFFIGIGLFLVTSIYTSAQIPLFFITLYSLYKGIMFALWNAIIHGIIDWHIWRGYKLLVMKRIQKNPDHELLADDPYDKANPWKYWEDKFFYDTIMLDQLLHGITIVGLALWMFS